jgi:hypothetical protein
MGKIKGKASSVEEATGVTTFICAFWMSPKSGAREA